jgi:hypothetical protein
MFLQDRVETTSTLTGIESFETRAAAHAVCAGIPCRPHVQKPDGKLVLPSGFIETMEDPPVLAASA